MREHENPAADVIDAPIARDDRREVEWELEYGRA